MPRCRRTRGFASAPRLRSGLAADVPPEKARRTARKALAYLSTSTSTPWTCSSQQTTCTLLTIPFLHEPPGLACPPSPPPLGRRCRMRLCGALGAASGAQSSPGRRCSCWSGISCRFPPDASRSFPARRSRRLCTAPSITHAWKPDQSEGKLTRED